MEPQNLESIKKIIAEFFEKITFEVEVEVSPQDGSTLLVSIKTDEPQILIGQGGQTLFEIQHILRAILRKKISASAEPEGFLYVDLDIN